MATKQKKSFKNEGLLTKSWFIVLVVGIIVLIGIAIVRFGNAATDNASLANSIINEYQRIRAGQSASSSQVTPRDVLVKTFGDCSNTGDFVNNTILNNSSQGPCVLYARRFLDIVMENNPSSASLDVSEQYSNNSGNPLSMQDRVKLFQQAINTNLNAADWSGVNAANKQKLLDDNRMSQDGSGRLSIPADGQVDPQTWFWLNVISYVYLSGN
jgi:hypothetical protein